MNRRMFRGRMPDKCKSDFYRKDRGLPARMVLGAGRMPTVPWFALFKSALALIACAAAHAGGFPIIADGQAKAVIYLAPESTPTAKFAAAELQSWLEKATGARLPVVDALPPAGEAVILVGPSEAATARGVTAAGLPSETCRIKTGDNWLVLLGDDDANVNPIGNVKLPPMAPVGTLTAVYRFLEKVCGIRWYMPLPEDVGTVVPHPKTVEVPPLDITARPAQDWRRLALHLPLRYGKGPDGQYYEDAMPQEWAVRIGYGAEQDAYIGHSFGFRMKKFEKTKPQIFALLPNGTRDFKTTCFGEGNLCLSQPDTLTEFVKCANEYFEKNPKAKLFSVSPNDCMTICRCPECLAWIPAEWRDKPAKELPEDLQSSLYSEYVWTFVGKVAEQLYKTHPDKLIGCIAYMQFKAPPKTVKLPPNVAVMLCKTRGAFWDKDVEKKIYDQVKAWHEVTPNIYTWEYYIWNFRSWAGRPMLTGYPIAFPHLIDKDIKFMSRYQRGEYTTANNSLYHPMLTHLNIYVTGKLLVDPDLDLKALLDEYYATFYGAAKDEMKAFWELAETCWMRDTSAFKGDNEKIRNAIFPKADMQKFLDLLAKAKGKVAPGSPELARLELLEKEMAPVVAAVSGKFDLPQFVSTRLSVPPGIEGIYQSTWGPSAIRLINEKGNPGDPATEIRVGHDSQNLYLSFEVARKPVAPVAAGTAKPAEPGTTKIPETLVITLQPKRDDKAVAKIIVNEDGLVSGAFENHPDFKKAADWDSHAVVRTRFKAPGWTGEVAIPWSSLGITLKPGDEIKANFARTGSNPTNPASPDSWSPAVTSRDPFDPARFGTITFTEE